MYIQNFQRFESLDIQDLPKLTDQKITDIKDKGIEHQKILGRNLITKQENKKVKDIDEKENSGVKTENTFLVQNNFRRKKPYHPLFLHQLKFIQMTFIYLNRKHCDGTVHKPIYHLIVLSSVSLVVKLNSINKYTM